MPRRLTPPAEKPPALLDAEFSANRLLRQYFRRENGIQARVARETGIKAPVLSRMSNTPGYPISMEQAVLIALASSGELQAAQLCPSRADVLAKFVAMETTEATT